MAMNIVSPLKFVGTISLGLLTGVSASLSGLALPALLTLPTATSARATHSYLSSQTRVYTSYLRSLTTVALFSAYLISPRRYRHPYLLYTSILAFVSGPGVDYAVALREGSNQQRLELDLEAQGDDVNGEEVRHAVERMRLTERVKTVIAGTAFAMGLVGIWGDGA